MLRNLKYVYLSKYSRKYSSFKIPRFPLLFLSRYIKWTLMISLPILCNIDKIGIKNFPNFCCCLHWLQNMRDTKKRSITKTMFKTTVIHPSIKLNDCAYSSCMYVYMCLLVIEYGKSNGVKIREIILIIIFRFLQHEGWLKIDLDNDLLLSTTWNELTITIKQFQIVYIFV